MNQWKMYIMINNSVKMSKGKIAAQVAHGTEEMTKTLITQYPDIWNSYNHPMNVKCKICLRANEEQMKKARELFPKNKSGEWCVPIFDAGATQVPAGTNTVIVFCPFRKNLDNYQNGNYFSQFKLL